MIILQYILQFNNLISIQPAPASVKLNALLIKTLLLSASIHEDFIDKSTQLSDLQNLEFYSDGSLFRPPDNLTPLMGFGWLLSSLTEFSRSIEQLG